MARTKVLENGKIRGFNLDDETVRILSFLSGSMNYSMSEWLRWNIRLQYESTDIGKKAKSIKEEIADGKDRIEELNKELNKIKELQTSFTSHQSEQKGKFVAILVQQIHTGKEYPELIEFARNQSIILHRKWSPEELLHEAYQIVGK